MKFIKVFVFISMHISFVQFYQVVQKQTVGEMGKWPIIWLPVVPEIYWSDWWAWIGLKQKYT